MSHITKTTLEVKDLAALKAALMDVLGLTDAEVEIHQEPVEFKDYYQKDTYKAHVFIRKASLARVFGSAFSDAGYLVEKGEATFYHDNLDSGLTKSYGRIKGHYAKHVCLAQAKKKGQRAEMVVENGKARIRVQVR